MEKDYVSCDNLWELVARDYMDRDSDNQKKIANLERMATRDSLTGALNRGAFLDQAGSMYAKDGREKKKAFVLMIDGDHFKDVNDTYGHGVGDEVLKYFVKTFKSSVRVSDIVGRYGGEEFAIYLSNIDLGGAAKVGKKINKAIYSGDVLPDGEKVSVSIGVSEVMIGGGDSNLAISEALNRADKALYDAKGNGRNETVLYRG